MAPADSARLVRVSVAYSARAGEVDEVALELAEGASVGDALRESGIVERHPGIDLEHLRIAVWGVLQPLDQVLRDQDRVELLRPLKVDPKEARRLRYRKQGR